MDVDSNLEIEFREISFHSAGGKSSLDLLKEVQKIQGWVQSFMNEKIVRPPSLKFDFLKEKETLLQLIQSIPPGPLSVFCQQQWIEFENKCRRMETRAPLSFEVVRQQKEESLKQLQKLMGRAIYAHQASPLKSQEILQGVSPLKEMENLYSASLRDLTEKVHSFYALEKESEIDSPRQACSLRISREIALALLTPEGRLNYPIIADLKTSFFPELGNLTEEEAMIARVLDQMGCSWQPLIDKVHKPQDQTSSSAWAIRADFDLTPATPIEDLHAKQAVLSALLSLHCPGAMKNYFALSCEIGSEEDFLKGALKQFGELIEFGSLGKLVGIKQDRFFFKNTLTNDNLHKIITIDSTGKLKKGVFFWDTPNFKFALRQMGLDLTPSLTAAVLERVSNRYPVQITPDQLIKAFAVEGLKTVPGATVDGLILAGRYGFSTVDNRILRAYEMALYSLSEAREEGYVRKRLIQAIEAPFQSLYANLQKKYTYGALAQFQTVFEKNIKNRIRYVYNGAIRCVIGSANKISLTGGFELYERHPYDLYKVGTRIATPQQFQELLLDAVQQSAQAIGSQTMFSIAQAVREVILNNQYLKAVFVAYEPANGKNSDPVAHYSQLFRTPMASQKGATPPHVEMTDPDLYFSPDIRMSQLKNATDLLPWILSLLEWKEKTGIELPHWIQMRNQASSYKASRRLHGDAHGIFNFLESGQTIPAWISERLMKSGRSIASWMVDGQTRQAYFQALGDLLMKEAPDAFLDFQQQTAMLINTPMTLSQFSTSMLKVLVRSLVHLDPEQIAYVADSLLLQCLPENILNILRKNAVPLFLDDTHQTQEYYFCVYFNPRLESLSFGMLKGDRSSLTPLPAS